MRRGRAEANRHAIARVVFTAGRAAALLVVLLAVGAIVPAGAHAAGCSSQTIEGVEIIELTDELGCDQGADLASRAVRDDGFLQEDGFYCRWGQGGTRPIARNGKTFYAGFCTDTTTEVEATFLARSPLETCDGDTSDGDDLRARYLDCKTARRVYRRSLTVGSRNPGQLPLRFRYAGERWTCRAYNPHHRNGNRRGTSGNARPPTTCSCISAGSRATDSDRPVS